jgi:hypothetical protein
MRKLACVLICNVKTLLAGVGELGGSVVKATSPLSPVELVGLRNDPVADEIKPDVCAA